MTADRLRPGDRVMLRRPADILATLDADGTLGGVPFMPEMLQHYGRIFVVSRRVEKICDTVCPVASRRMLDTVFLEDLRCDGSAHGGCQAACRLYWKDEWLARMAPNVRPPPRPDDAALAPLARLVTSRTRQKDQPEHYRCQATEARRATHEAARLGHAAIRARGAGRQHRLAPAVRPARLAHPAVGAAPPRPPPGGAVAAGAATPREAAAARSAAGRVGRGAFGGGDRGDAGCAQPMHRGLYFSAPEMATECGRRYRVRRRVSRIIEEASGRMLTMKNDCVELDGPVCTGDRSVGRWFCAREIYPLLARGVAEARHGAGRRGCSAGSRAGQDSGTPRHVKLRGDRRAQPLVLAAELAGLRSFWSHHIFTGADNPMDGASVSLNDAARATASSGCRACGGVLHPFVDLGVSPPCEGFLAAAQLAEPETFYPLDVQICGACWLAQLREYVSPASIFSEYAYFSSYSGAWLEARAATMSRWQRNGSASARNSFVVELASNDGYLLRNVVARGIPVLGIEPARNVAAAAEQAGVPTLVALLRPRAGARSWPPRDGAADLVVGNNVLAQVPDFNDFVAGIAALLKPEGVVTLEFPHLLRLIDEQPVRHHLSRALLLFLAAVGRASARRARPARSSTSRSCRRMADRCACTPAAPERLAATASLVAQLRTAEARSGARDLATYAAFAARVQRKPSTTLLDFLIALKRDGATASPATARRARATRCSTTAASAPISSTSRSTATPTSRASSCPAPTSRSAARRSSTRRGPITC